MGAKAKTAVLVVEDEPLQLMMAVALVEDAGFEPISAINADEAKSRNDIRIVFTDIDMPGSMDGLKLAAAVRGRWPPIEIVVVSGHSPVQQHQLPERGVFFSKPYDEGQVVATLRKLA